MMTNDHYAELATASKLTWPSGSNGECMVVLSQSIQHLHAILTVCTKFGDISTYNLLILMHTIV